MIKKMLIDATQPEETRMAIVGGEKLLEYESEVLNLKPIKGNIYLAKIIRVEPSLQAAFVDYGGQRHGFLAYNEIHPDYFKIPTSDKEKLLEAENDITSNYNVEENNTSVEDKTENKRTKIKNSSHNNKKSFLDKILNFFNYKPIEDNEIISKDDFYKKREHNKQNKHKNIPIHRKYSIQEVIKRNQVILVQIVKEERGNKGAAVTTRLSLAGKYCVLMPNTNKGGGISRKITDLKLRKNLKSILNSLEIKKGIGVIIRTAGQTMKNVQINRDYKALLDLWNDITSKTIKSTAPCLIHEEGNLLKRSIRDYFSNDISEVIVNNKDVFKKAKEIMKFFMPSHIKQIKMQDKSENSLFGINKIEKQVNEIYKPIVYLRSGGYLVINQTEALVAIDVNSGKYTKQRNIEDTALKTNLEAAEEIPFQLRLRDLAGLIVVDFIDMLERSNNFKVEKKIRESIKNDRARVQYGRISNFGLLEISRQRLKQVFSTTTSHKCNHCNGTGRTNSIEFTAMQILRVCEESLINTTFKNLTILVNADVANFINEQKINFLNEIIKKTKRNIYIKQFSEFSISESAIFNKQEIIYENCDDELKLANAVTHLDSKNNNISKIDNNSDSFEKKHKKNIIKSNKIKPLKSIKNNNLSKKSNIEESSILESSETTENSASDLKQKRTSFRVKAENFTKTSEKKNSKVKKLKKMSKSKVKDEALINSVKREGWWSQ